MTGHQPRLGDLTDETARALELVRLITAAAADLREKGA